MLKKIIVRAHLGTRALSFSKWRNLYFI